MHHRQENKIKMLVAYANYDNYVRALQHLTHSWPSSSDMNRGHNSNAPMITLTITGSSSHQQNNREQCYPHELCGSSPSPDQICSSRQSPPWSH